MRRYVARVHSGKSSELDSELPLLRAKQLFEQYISHREARREASFSG
jgi:hypothetical protein